MEWLDIYDENGNHIGTEDRKVVHQKGLWHKNVHCWLYTKDGYALFQRRSASRDNPLTLYCTASGHLAAGETVEQGFAREVKEELGVEININNAELIDKGPFKANFQLKDGTWFNDRVWYHLYICRYDHPLTSLQFDEEELEGIYKLWPQDAIDLFEGRKKSIPAEAVVRQNGKNIIKKCNVAMKDFLVLSHETAMQKYGIMLRAVQEKVKHGK